MIFSISIKGKTDFGENSFEDSYLFPKFCPNHAYYPRFKRPVSHLLTITKTSPPYILHRSVFYLSRFKHLVLEENNMINVNETGGGFVLILKLLKLFATSNLNTDRLPALISQYLQIHDDYENLNNQTYYDFKGFCEDISEGKFGFPIIHAINTHPEEGKLIMDIMRQRTYDIELKKTCLSLITKCGSFQYTRNKLKVLQSKLLEEMKLFCDGEEIADTFRTTFYITREDQD